MSIATLAENTARGSTPGLNPQRWWVLAVMSLSAFMIFLDNTVVNTALPSIARDLNASTSTLQWVVDGYTLILAGLLLAAGMMGDRFGRRRFLAIGMLIFGAASAGAALATSSEALILFRALQGAGAALVLPATLSIITDVFPREERATAIGIWTGVGALGLGLGPQRWLGRGVRRTLQPAACQADGALPEASQGVGDGGSDRDDPLQVKPLLA